MSLVAAWLLFPTVLALLCAGCGTLVARAAGLRGEVWQVVPLGYAALVVVTSFAVWIPGGARLAVPVVVGTAVAGGVVWLSGSPRLRRAWLAPLAAAAVVFLSYGAPILASGEATFAGYISLDDASTLFGITDRALEDGRSLDGLAPSSYEASLSASLASGYPLGTLLPLGVGARLTGQDLAWVFQPTIAFLAALLALGLYALAGWAAQGRLVRGATAVVAAQPALLYAYGLWDGIKEVAAAALLAALAPLAVRCARPADGERAWVGAAVAAAALALCMSPGAVVWLAPALAVVGALALLGGSWRGIALAAGLTVLLAAPELGRVRTFLDVDTVSAWGELANLVEPLEPVQVAGIWPAVDFRVDPELGAQTAVLIALVAGLALLGAVAWVEARAWPQVVFAVSLLAGAAVVWALSSAWVEAKALAVASPAVLLAAGAGLSWLAARGRGVEAAVGAAAVAGGVLWSNALAYQHVWLAPRGQLAELEAIGERFAGDGPALMTEYQPYGVRHFLRRLDPEGASELRRRFVRLRDGSTLPKSGYANVDDVALADLLVYRTLVLRRSPAESRPPSAYGVRWRGRWYEVWQRPQESRAITEHLPLGDGASPASVPACAEVQRLAADGAELAAVPRYGVAVAALPASGAARMTVERRGRYALWLGGSVHGRVDAFVDGRRLGSVRRHLNNTGTWIELGQVALEPGTHEVRLRFAREALRPGSSGVGLGAGPLALAPAVDATRLTSRSARDASQLCGRSLDWVEARASG